MNKNMKENEPNEYCHIEENTVNVLHISKWKTLFALTQEAHLAMSMSTQALHTLNDDHSRGISDGFRMNCLLL